LVRWKEATQPRKPLLVNGARQTGKTWLLRDFAARCYENSIHLTLDLNRRVASYFEEDLAPKRLIQLLEAEFQQRIIPGKTLIVLDEIQASERALSSLKHFAELAPEYHVAAAGSLLGVAVNREKFSFPVGQVHTLDLFPFDFEEYLWACGDEALADELRAAFETLTPLPEGLHLKAIDRYREYLVVGGLPACVDTFTAGGSLLEVAELQAEIQRNYVADMAKYAAASEAVKIRACYNSLPAQLGKENHKFQYKVVQRGGSAALFGSAIEWLALAGVVLKCRRVEQGHSPLPIHEDLSSFKLYLGDIGLLSHSAGVRQADILTGAPHSFQGALAENYVAQQLAVRHRDLFYWVSGNTAEVDFVVQSQAGITAIEVKSGVNTRSRSLTGFLQRYQPYRAIRLSLKNFGSGEVWSVPLYAAHLV
jgi:predicted AAA+ superfamily ATPase